MLRFTVLGGVGATVDEQTIAIRGERTRTVLAVLCAHVNQVVSVDKLLEDAWAGAPPASGKNALRVQVNQLRKSLGNHSATVVTEAPGYVLRIPESALDATRYEKAVLLAEQVIQSNPERATQLLDEAEALWQGTPYADVIDAPFVDAERRQLERLRESAQACRFDVELALGRHTRVLQEIDAHLAEFPYEERVWRAKMIATYRAGAQAEAIRIYQDLRSSLAEIGLDPSPESNDLELRLLNHDPSLGKTEVRQSNLPRPITSLFGRIEEIHAVTQALDSSRLVTLRGPGGIGKTRLGLEAANAVRDRYEGGVWFVDLTAVHDNESLVAAISSALGLYVPTSDAAWDILSGWASGDDRLVVLDNCEQVAQDAGQLIDRLLHACPNVTVMATSRLRLGVPGENLVTVGPLSVPGGEEDKDNDAMRLLVDRASGTKGDLDIDGDEASFVSITRILEGHPLAIELAAARLRYLSGAELLERLESSLLAVLSDASRTGSDRHRALDTALDTSWDCLSPAQHEALTRMSLFRGGFTIDEAVAVLPDDLNAEDAVASLVDASLIELSHHGNVSRFRSFESIRQYAWGKLEEFNRPDAMRRHAEVFLDLTSSTAPLLVASRQTIARTSLLLESANIRAAIEYAQILGDAETQLRLAASASNFWFETGQHETGREILTAVLADTSGLPDSTPRGEVLRSLVELNAWNGDVPAARRIAEDQAAFAKATSDPADELEVVGSEALVAFTTGDYAAAATHYRRMLESAERHALRPRPYAQASIAYLLAMMGRADEADEAIDEAISLGGDLGSDAIAALRADFGGWRAFQAGDLELADKTWLEAEQAYEQLNLVPMVADMRQLRSWVRIEIGMEGAISLLADANKALRRCSLRPYVIRGSILDAAAVISIDPEQSLLSIKASIEEAAATESRLNAVWGLVYAAQCAKALDRTKDAEKFAQASAELASRVPLQYPAWLDWLPFTKLPQGNSDHPDVDIISDALAHSI